MIMNKKNIFPNNSIYSILNNINSESIQYFKSDYKYLDNNLRSNQKTPEEILETLETNDYIDKLLTLEQEVYEEELNKDLKIHGQRHILNVILFSAILGIKLLSKEDIKLLLYAAKYHDSGRISEDDDEHAHESRVIAKQRLQNKVPQKDLSIIMTAIEYHEVPRRTSYEEKYFETLAKHNGITEEELERTRKISEILKDADALDRTRFVNRARLDNRYLYYDYSKELIKFAADLQEEYAKEDLKNYDYDEEDLNDNTPQELLRKIRKNIRTL